MLSAVSAPDRRPPLLASKGFWREARIAHTTERAHFAGVISLVVFLLAYDALVEEREARLDRVRHRHTISLVGQEVPAEDDLVVGVEAPVQRSPAREQRLVPSVIVAGYRAVGEEGFLVGWTAIAAVCSAMLVTWLAVVNAVYLVLQVIMAARDVSVRSAVGEALRLMRGDTGRVLGVFLVTACLVGVATLASIVATAGLGLISFVPFVGLAVLPLQLLAWLLRGLVFQYLGLTSAGAYLFLYDAPVEAVDAATVPGGVPA